MLTNPIILKELIQASHRRRLFLLRVALPLGAMIILAPQVIFIAIRYGGNWRMMKQIAQPLFTTCAWMMFVAFIILAASEAKTSLHREWSNNTMELLCATPIGFARIVYGKLAGILLKVFSAGLALLPILGVWLSLGRMPPAMVGGALGVIVTSAVLAASLSLMDGAATRPRRGRFFTGPVFILLYAGIVAGVGAWLREPHPLLVGALPPWSFYCVMNDVQVGGLSPGRFALIASLEPLVFALGPILVSPWLLARTYRKVYGARAAKRPKRWYVPGPLRRFLYRRPALGEAEDPFFWQEKGAPTLVLRAVVWGALAVIFLPMLGAWAFLPEAAWRAMRADRAEFASVFAEPEFYFTVACIIAGIMSLAAVFYATNVFAREKGRKTLDAFMMVVNDPRKLYRAKLKAVLWALKLCYPAIAALLIVAGILEDSDFQLTGWPMAIVLAAAVLGPPVTATIGLVFSAAAKTSGGAVAGIVLAPFAYQVVSIAAAIPLIFPTLIAVALGGASGVFLVWSVLAVGAVVAVHGARWRWQVWKLTFLLAIWLFLAGVVGSLLGLAARVGSWYGWLVPLAGGCLAWMVCGYYWYRFGAKIFERCMLGDKLPPRYAPGVKPVVQRPASAKL